MRGLPQKPFSKPLRWGDVKEFLEVAELSGRGSLLSGSVYQKLEENPSEHCLPLFKNAWPEEPSDGGRRMVVQGALAWEGGWIEVQLLSRVKELLLRISSHNLSNLYFL